MKYKHLVAAAFLAIAACGSISAATSASSLRIYINPGHGSWTSDDRPCRTVGSSAWNSSNPDTTGFFESNTDLEKGFGLLEKLIEYGLTFDRTLNQTGDNSTTGAARSLTNNIVMSRVKNGPWPVSDTAHSASYNRSLSEIAKEVENNNFDMFISIHSNATTEGSTTNYPLYEYRGYDSSPSVSGSDAMAKKCWPYGYANPHMVWTNYSSTNMNIRGDVSFYGSGSTVNGYYGYLGVLKHGVPGFLVEGYFHTYQPARQRAMNWDVDRQEGVAYGRGIADYFGLTKESTGDIYGIVRSSEETYSSTYYTPNSNSNDVYLPLNGAKVTLSQNGSTIATYTTDDKYNGAFVFTGLQPGSYTMTFSYSNYATYSESVTVTAANTTYPIVFLGSSSADYDTYPDEAAGSVTPAWQYNMEQEYVDNAISELSGKTIRRTVLNGDNLYVLALDSSNDPTIIVYDTANKKVLANVSTSGMTGDYLNVSDIQVTSDGVLIACPKSLVEDYDTYGSDAATMNIYKWANDANGLPTGNPTVWFVSDAAGWWYHAYCGETMAYFGTSEEGMLVYTAETNGSSEQVRLGCIPVSEGVKGEATYTKPTIGGSELTYFMLNGDDGGTFHLYPSPLSSNSVILASSSSTIPVCDFKLVMGSTTEEASTVAESLIPASTPVVNFFKYAGQSYMVVPAIENSKSVGVKLFDVSDGLAGATEITTTNTTIDAADLTNISVNGATVVTANSSGAVTAADINLFLTRGNTTLSKFTTKGIEQPAMGDRAEYAYDLSCEQGDGSYVVTFSSTGDAEAEIILTNSDDGTTYTFDIGSVTEGENTATIDVSEIPEGTYSWKVEIVSKQISDVTKVFDSSVPVHGVTINRNSSSAYYGYAFASHAESPKGIYMFDPALNLVSSTPYLSDESWSSNTSKGVESPYRLAMNPNSNKVVICDYGDTHAGLWAWDPANSSSVSQMYAGTLNTSTGAYTYNGSVIGGGVTGACFYGSGSSTQLYAFCKDYPSNDENYLVVYDLGENETITSLPSRSQDNTHLANGDINVVVNDKGVWCSENRSSGNNTGTYAPAFTLFDFSGNALFYGSDLTDLDGSAYGGMALSDDFSKFAIVNASNQVFVYNVTWNGSTPSFAKSYDFTFCDSGNGYCYQMAFDPAGNLYIATNVGLQVYGLPNNKPVTDTESSEKMTVNENNFVEGVSMDKADTDLKVYPNPAASTVNVEAGVEINSISLYNLAGAMMKVDANVNGSSATINVGNLASGMYLLNVDGKSVKLIKK